MLCMKVFYLAKLLEGVEVQPGHKRNPTYECIYKEDIAILDKIKNK